MFDFIDILTPLGERYFPFPSITLPVLAVVGVLLATKITGKILKFIAGG